MSWAPNDLLADTDLLAYEPRILSQFGQVRWLDARQKALEDWLWPQLLAANFTPGRFRTRYQPTAVLIDASGTFTDVTAAATSDTADDLNLATAFATTSTRLVIGDAEMFRGVSVRVAETPSATAATLTVSLWRDAWKAVAVTDGTQSTGGTPFSGGGAITWALPEDWVMRTVSTVADCYWARLVLSTVPTSAKAGQVTVIRRSRLCGAVTCRTLAQIFRAAPLNQDGPWAEKAAWYEAEAERMLARVLPLLGGEFEHADTIDDTIDSTEAAQSADEARETTAWTWERA